MANKKRCFNLIDALIIIVVIAVIFIGWMVFSNGDNGNGTEITYKVNVLKAEKYLSPEIQIGDKVFDSVKNFEIGEITDVVVTDATESIYDPELNVYRTVTVPERDDILITIKGDGSLNDDTVVVNGYELSIGKKMYIKGANFATEAIAWEIGGEE